MYSSTDRKQYENDCGWLLTYIEHTVIEYKLLQPVTTQSVGHTIDKFTQYVRDKISTMLKL